MTAIRLDRDDQRKLAEAITAEIDREILTKLRTTSQNWFDQAMQRLVDSGICRYPTEEEMGRIVQPHVNEILAEQERRTIEILLNECRSRTI